MERFFQLRDRWMKFIKKYLIACIVFCVALLIFIIVMTCMESKSITIKQEVFDHEVNTELDLNASFYLDGAEDDRAHVQFDTVDITKLGTYEGFIEYDDESYTIHFNIIDTTKPEIIMDKTEFSFSLNTSLEDMNQEINDHITVKDNFDDSFETIVVIHEIPSEISEQVYEFSMKDKAGNESDKVQIKVTFTEPEEEPENEEPENNGPTSNSGNSSSGSTSGGSTSSGSSSSGNQGSSGNSGTSGGSSSSTPTPQPSPTPTPTPEPMPTPEPSKPNIDSLGIPADALIGGEFDTREAGEAWARQHNENPNSEWYHKGETGIKLSNGKWYVWIEK